MDGIGKIVLDKPITRFGNKLSFADAQSGERATVNNLWLPDTLEIIVLSPRVNVESSIPRNLDMTYGPHTLLDTQWFFSTPKFTFNGTIDEYTSIPKSVDFFRSYGGYTVTDMVAKTVECLDGSCRIDAGL